MKIILLSYILISASILHPILSQTSSSGDNNSSTNPAAKINNTQTPSSTSSENLIPQFLPFTKDDSSFKCLITIRPVLAAMTTEEQKLWFNAFIVAKGQETSDSNLKTCFDREIIRKGLRDVVDTGAKSLNASLTATSKKFRSAMTCLKTTLDKLHASEASLKSFNANMKESVSNQVSVNQCAASFLTKLLNVLNARKRYLLLNTVDLPNLARISSSVINFPWSEEEMKTIVPTFIDYANCYSSLPSSYYASVQDVYVALSKDEVCKGTSTLRFLENTTTITNEPTEPSKADQINNSKTGTNEPTESPKAEQISNSKTETNGSGNEITELSNFISIIDNISKESNTELNKDLLAKLDSYIKGQRCETEWRYKINLPTGKLYNCKFDTKLTSCNQIGKVEFDYPLNFDLVFGCRAEQYFWQLHQAVKANGVQTFDGKFEDFIRLMKIFPDFDLLEFLNTDNGNHIVNDFKAYVDNLECSGNWDYSISLSDGGVIANCPDKFKQFCPKTNHKDYERDSFVLNLYFGCDGGKRIMKILQEPATTEKVDQTKPSIPDDELFYGPLFNKFGLFSELGSFSSIPKALIDMVDFFDGKNCVDLIWSYTVDIQTGNYINNCPNGYKDEPYCVFQSKLPSGASHGVTFGCIWRKSYMGFSQDITKMGPSTFNPVSLFKTSLLGKVKQLLESDIGDRLYKDLYEIWTSIYKPCDNTWHYSINFQNGDISLNCPGDSAQFCPANSQNVEFLKFDFLPIVLTVGCDGAKRYFKTENSGIPRSSLDKPITDSTTKPVDTGKPEDASKPEDTTKPVDAGKPEDASKPEDTSKPVDTAKPEDTAKPDINKDSSKENAQSSDNKDTVSGPYSITDESNSLVSLSIETRKFLNKLLGSLEKRNVDVKLVNLLKLPIISGVALTRKDNLIQRIISNLRFKTSSNFNTFVKDSVEGKTCSGTWFYNFNISGDSLTISCSESIQNSCPNKDEFTPSTKSYKKLDLYLGCEYGTSYGVAYVHSADSEQYYWDTIGAVEDKSQAVNCAKELSSSLGSASSTSTKCLPSLKKSCSDTLADTCKKSGLGDSINKLMPLVSGDSLPSECHGDDMKACLAWINNNLLKNSLTVDYDKVYNLQSTIASITKTRILGEVATIEVTTEDSLAKYPETQIEKSSYEISESDLEVDGTTSKTSKSVDTLIAGVVEGVSSGSGFYSFSFGVGLIISLVIF
jgi:hypothetical protein